MNMTGVLMEARDPMVSVRCFFYGQPDPPEPFDLLFARVPCEDESVMYRESRWFVTRVTWTSEGPYLDLSYGDLCFGLSCACGFAACLEESFDHKCPLAGVNAAWSLFLAIAAFALVVGMAYR